MNQAKPSRFVLLAAVDLEGDSPGVISSALELATRHGDAEVHVVAVVSPFDGIAVPVTGEFMELKLRESVERLRGFVRVQVDELCQRLPAAAAQLGGVQVHCSVGRPANEIVWLAAHLDADLIVVGTHGRKVLRRLLLGSVAEKVSRLAGCPVLVVREKHHVAEWRAPEIEPICPECASARRLSNGGSLWCERHSIHHTRAHVACRAPHDSGPSAIESVTGT